VKSTGGQILAQRGFSDPLSILSWPWELHFSFVHLLLDHRVLPECAEWLPWATAPHTIHDFRTTIILRFHGMCNYVQLISMYIFEYIVPYSQCVSSRTPSEVKQRHTTHTELFDSVLRQAHKGQGHDSDIVYLQHQVKHVWYAALCRIVDMPKLNMEVWNGLMCCLAMIITSLARDLSNCPRLYSDFTATHRSNHPRVDGQYDFNSLPKGSKRKRQH
jgi:hypothetical protein